tara:strand:- start:12 stop:461 length:450 start_codon:yes stop_codon:yes gene_type:complete
MTRTSRASRLKYCLNAVLLIAPAWFFYASLTPPAQPDPWAPAALGEWTMTPQPSAEPPYPHDGKLIRDFQFRICDGCAAAVRTAIAHVAITPPTLDDTLDGVIHGHGDHLEAHVPWPHSPGAQHRLWIVAQDWAGRIHTASWPLPSTHH